MAEPQDEDTAIPVRDRPACAATVVRWTSWSWCAVGVAVLVFLWLFSDKGRARHAVFDLQRLSDTTRLYGDPQDQPASWGRDSSEDLAPFRAEARSMAGTGTTFARATRLLDNVANLGSAAGVEAITSRDPIRTDDPVKVFRALRDGTQRGNCAHYSWAYMLMAGAAGIDARVVGMDGDVWVDGDGHALIEVYLPELEAWALMDPQNNSYVLDARGRPLSLLAVRAALQSRRGEDVKLVQGSFYTGDKNAEETVSYYKSQIDRLVYEPQRSIMAGYGKVYESWLARALALDRWPRNLRRLAENVLWQKDSRLLYVDAPEYDFFFVERWAYRIAWILILAALIPLAALALMKRRSSGRATSGRGSASN